jgi:hypothetical protein
MPTAAVFTEVEAGDTVLVRLRDGNREQFVVAEVQPETLVASDGEHFPFVNIAALYQVENSPGQTIGAAVGIVLI